MKLKSQAAKTNGPAASNLADGPKTFRPLAWNELVVRGDFVADGHQGFEAWEGPSGFRADAFVKTIYRQNATPLARGVKLP